MEITARQNSDWGARAAWEAQRMIADHLENVEIVAWGVDSRDNVLWLNINTGELNIDIAVSREFFEYGFFRPDFKAPDGFYASNKPTFISYVQRAKPGFFSQNGVARFLYNLDLESPDDCQVKYVDGGAIRNFADEAAAEAAERAKAEEEWKTAEKKRQARATELAKAAREAKAAAEAEATEAEAAETASA